MELGRSWAAALDAESGLLAQARSQLRPGIVFSP